ncbi:MAG TPA: hypothetical protein VFU46_05900 [Gemmatimonadales bacterium]|nr:hypothetical protein [Gemmatimonadales bacterium]
MLLRHRPERPRPAERAAALALLALVRLAPGAGAQSVVELTGGGSSLQGGYGVTANVWRDGVEGWIGLGYLDGLRAGAFARKGIGRDTLRLGNDALTLRYPTDVFGTGYVVLAQGASWQHAGTRTSFLAFGGAASAGLSAPSFLAMKARAAMGALAIHHRASPSVSLTAHAVGAERPTLVPGIEWRASPDATAALTVGVGAGRPYAASSLLLRRGPVAVRASYAWNPDRFRRADVPAPNQTELDRENVVVTYQISPDVLVGAGRQNYVQDSADAATRLRASGNSAFVGGRFGELRVNAGVYDSRANGVSNLSSYVALGRRITEWLDAEAFVLQSRPEGLPPTTTPLVNLRERVSPRVGLMQQLVWENGGPRILFGGSLLTALGEIGVDYQIVHQPFEPFNPFRSALSLTARLQLGRYSTSLGTYLQPDGRVEYAASAGTFLYMGEFGVQPQRIGGGAIARYVVRGRVVDERGEPVEGAAVDIGGELVFTDSRGEFLLRVRRPARYTPVVQLDEFLLPGAWRVRAAPERVTADTEALARAAVIVLERMQPAPSFPAPEPSDTLRPVPESR